MEALKRSWANALIKKSSPNMRSKRQVFNFISVPNSDCDQHNLSKAGWLVITN